MIEVFIPTKIKNYNILNNISDRFELILKNNYKDIEINKFKSSFFEGTILKSDYFLEDLIILCNGEFGEFYFVDYDVIKYYFIILGTKIVGENNIYIHIENITNNIENIIKDLKSTKLLTNTKKQEIKNKINKSFFGLSGILFLLYKLKYKANSSFEEMNNYDGLAEYKGQSLILKETLKTQKINLQSNIDKLEGKVELFINTIKSLIQ